MLIEKNENLVCGCGNYWFGIKIETRATTPTIAIRCTICGEIQKYKDGNFTDMREGEDR